MDGGKDLETYEKLLPWREGEGGVLVQPSSGKLHILQNDLGKKADSYFSECFLLNHLLTRNALPERCKRGMAARKPLSRGHKCGHVEGTRASLSQASWVCPLQTPKSDFKPHVLFMCVPRADPRTEEGTRCKWGSPFILSHTFEPMKDLWSREWY